MRLFTKKYYQLPNIKGKAGSAPLVIIKKDSNNFHFQNNADIKEYMSIDEAIADLESDPNVSKEKIEKLKLSLRNLKNKSLIRIKNGEII